MNEKEIDNLNEKEIDNELFREIECSWEKKDLINHIVDGMSKKDKIIWIKEWFGGEKWNW